MAWDYTNLLEVDATIEGDFTFTDRAGNLDDGLSAEGTNGDWCLGIGSTPSSGTGATANPSGRSAYVYTEASSPIATDVWAMKRNSSFDTSGSDRLKIDVKLSLAINATTDIHVEYATAASPNETTDWTILKTIAGNGSADGSWIDDTWDFSAISSSTLWVRVRMDTNGNSSYLNDFGISTWREYSVTAQANITNVTPSSFKYDNADIDIAGVLFGSTQGTGKVYISDASTLAGSANEVDISSAINTWADTLINLDLTQLSSTEHESLSELGEGSLFLILVNDNSEEDSFAITGTRANAVVLKASANIGVSGANTTAQLTAPSGKTTGDFGGGRIQDDENPSDAVDLGTDEYGEWEWCIELSQYAIDTKVYEFRVLVGGGEADTVSVTPQITASFVTILNATGTSNGSSSVSGGIKQKSSVSGSINGSSSLVSSSDSIKDVTGTSNGSSSVLVASKVKDKISGTSSGSSDTSGNATKTTRLTVSGASNGGSSTSATTSVISKVSGALFGSSVLLSSTDSIKNVSGNSSGVSSISVVSISRQKTSGVANTSSFVTGNAVTRLRTTVSSSVNGVSSVSVETKSKQKTSGTSSGSSSLAATTDSIKSVSASTNNSSSVVCVSKIKANASSVVDGSSSVLGSVGIKLKVSGTVNSASQINGAVKTVEKISGSSFSQSIISVVSETSTRMTASGTISGSSSLSSETKTKNKVSASISGTSVLLVSTDSIKNISGASSSFSDLSVITKSIVKVSASLEGVSSVSGNATFLTSVRSVSGTISGVSYLEGYIKKTSKISGIIDGHTVVSGNAKILLPADKLSGVVDGSSNVSVESKLKISVSGVSNSESSVSSQTKSKQKVLGITLGVSTVIGSIEPIKSVLGASNGVSSVSVTSKSIQKVSANIQCGSVVTGNAIISSFILKIIGSSNGASSVNVTTSLISKLSGIINGTSIVNGNLTFVIGIDGNEIIERDSFITLLKEGNSKISNYLNEDSMVLKEKSFNSYIK